MRTVALVLFLLGLFVLYGGFLLRPLPYDPLGHSSVRDLVYLSGVVGSERAIAPDFRILYINNVSVVCSCSRSYLASSVLIVGLQEVYEGKPQIRALSVRVLR